MLACTPRTDEIKKKLSTDMFGLDLINMKNKKNFFCCTPTHVGMHTSHRRNKKKVEHRHVWSGPHQHEK